jgi:hypothetical protein
MPTTLLRVALAGAALVWCASVAAAQAAPAPPPPPPPTAPEPAAPKPATGQLLLPGVESVTLGGAIRVRGEFWRPATYDVLPAPPADAGLDASWVLLQTRLWLAVEVNPRVAARVELQDSRIWGTEGGATGNLAGLDLFQGLVQFRMDAGGPLELTLGRYAVPAFGSQRLMSPLPWHNYGRAFDGGRLVWSRGTLKLHALGALLTEASLAGTFPDTYADDDHWFTALVAEWRPPDSAWKADAYLFGRWSESRTTASEVGPADRWRQGTAGVWTSWAPAPMAFTAEAYGQFGRQGRDDIRAWAFAATASVAAGPALQVMVEYGYASGDARPTDGDVNTFDPLFPFAHLHNGHIDAVQWSNVHVAKLATTLALGPLAAACEGWTVHVDVLGFWLASRRDAWYGVTGGAWRRDPTGTVAGSGALGSEVDGYLKGPLGGGVDLWLGWSHYFPGRYVHDTATPSSGGDDRDQDWLFAQLVTRF